MPISADNIDYPLPMALALASLAGAVDAIGAAALGNLFVSFMSGNTTQLGTAAVALDLTAAARAGAVILAFVVGVIGGEVVAAQIRPKLRSTGLLLMVALLLTAAAWAARVEAVMASSMLMSSAMGLLNAVMRRAGRLDVALTYVTGTLVRLGRAVAAALLRRASWLDAAPFAALWTAFLCGAVAGGTLTALATNLAIPACVAIAVLLAACALRL